MSRILSCVAALMFAGSIPSAALAEEWVFVNIGDTGSAYFYDSDSLKVGAEYAEVWVMWDHSRDKTERYRTSKAKWILGCKDKTVTLIYSISYWKNGQIGDTFSVPQYLREASPIIPGSVADRIADLVCVNI